MCRFKHPDILTEFKVKQKERMIIMAFMCLYGYGECDCCGFCNKKGGDCDAEK